MTLLFSAIEKLVPLTQEQRDFFTGIVRERKTKKGQFLLHEGSVQRNSFFVISGLLISYYVGLDGKEHLLQFGRPGWWISDLNSFTRQKEAMLNIKAFKDSTVIELPFAATTAMFQQIPQMDIYFRIITERAFIDFQERIIQNNSINAKDRLALFAKKYPDLLTTIPQKMIASYLGISPEFLSRIKKEGALGKS